MDTERSEVHGLAVYLGRLWSGEEEDPTVLLTRTALMAEMTLADLPKGSPWRPLVWTVVILARAALQGDSASVESLARQIKTLLSEGVPMGLPEAPGDSGQSS